MKILCNNIDLEKDMQDLINLFYDEEDCPFSVEHNLKQENNNYVSTIYIGAGDNTKTYVKNFSIDENASELLRKSLLKRYCKNHLYEVVSYVSKKTLPWGSLTGVRPTKFARDMVERGEIKPHLISEVLVRDYHKKKKKAKLVVQILKNQKCIIKKSENFRKKLWS